MRRPQLSQQETASLPWRLLLVPSELSLWDRRCYRTMLAAQSVVLYSSMVMMAVSLTLWSGAGATYLLVQASVLCAVGFVAGIAADTWPCATYGPDRADVTLFASRMRPNGGYAMARLALSVSFAAVALVLMFD